MSSKYRVAVQYDPRRAAYIARAPELIGCEAEGPTRVDALANLEEELDAQVETMRDQGNPPPPAVDDWAAESEAEAGADTGSEPATEPLGTVTARVSASVHRELQYHARAEGVELDALVAELLVEALALRNARELRPRVRRRSHEERQDRDNRGNQRGREGRGARGSYSDIMDDKASFLEYVRGLDNDPGRSRGPNRRNRRRGRGRGPEGQGGNNG